MTPKAWDHLQWGIKWTDADGHDGLLGLGWDETVRLRTSYPGEPGRALLFTTRRAAADWCRAKRAQYAGRQDSLAKWRFTPVRVRERLEVVL